MTVAAIIAIIQADKVLKRLREKILSNRGTFRDTFEYSNRAAELLGANFSESVLAMSLDDRVSACVELLRDRYDDIMPLLDAVQKRADLKNKLTIAPKHPPFNAERAEQIGTSLRDLSVSDERIQRRARSAPATATRAIHDDYIEANVELRSSAGIKCYISRVTDGNCCDWCTRVAGRYEYGTEPEGIFHRHDNCGCSVTYENGRERQDVWSKKTWTVPEDAGAPEPVRFTQEQAAAAGAEPPRVFSVGEARELNDVKVKENTAKPEDVYNSSIDNSEESGTIDIEVDEFVPCLKDAETGEILPTEVARIPRKQLSEFTEATGWGVDWKDRPKDEYTLGVFLKGDDKPQGLISLKPVNGGLYMAFASTAPQNNKQITGGKKKYIGVGGHLFAAAVKESLSLGYDGAVYGFAKNEELLRYYIREFGAIPAPVIHPFQFFIADEAAQNLIDTYNYERR